MACWLAHSWERHLKMQFPGSLDHLWTIISFIGISGKNHAVLHSIINPLEQAFVT